MPSCDADVIQNQLNVLLAKQHRLLSSWLPPRKPEELANAKTEEELEMEEAAIFTPVPATYATHVILTPVYNG